MEKEKTLQELKIQADRDTAYESFEMYVELLATMKDLEPQCFKQAIRILKEKRFTKCKKFLFIEPSYYF